MGRACGDMCMERMVRQRVARSPQDAGTCVRAYSVKSFQRTINTRACGPRASIPPTCVRSAGVALSLACSRPERDG